MERLFIEGTDCTPKVFFNPNGKMIMGGRSLSEDVKSFFLPLIDWVINLETTQVHFDIKFEYLNTSSSKELLELLKCMDVNYKVHEIHINWYYEFDNYDVLELGQILKENLSRTKFSFLECVEQV